MIHNIIIEVPQKGLAVQNGRFKEKGMEFSVFHSSEKSVSKIIDELSNEI